MATLLRSSASLSDSIDVLGDIRQPDCNLAIWERHAPIAPSLLDLNGARDVRFQTRLDRMAADLSSQMKAAGFRDGAEWEALRADVIMLAEAYCRLLQMNACEVRLEIVTTDSCRKWHSDYVKARLITTYCGSGTQWLNSADAERVRDGQEPNRIGQMRAGDVGLFKGKLASETPAIHRSPPIAGTGETRLLLVLNPIEAV